MERRPVPKINSRQKGKRGELELVHYLQMYHGIVARRGQQYAGGPDSPDIIVPSIPAVHFEVKRCEKTALYDWIQQADDDRGFANKVPVVVHKKNRKYWLAILDFNDLLWILRKAGMVENGDSNSERTPETLPFTASRTG